VWFFYCSTSSTEIDSYVAYDYQEGHWLIGSLDRTAGFDRGVFRKPIWASSAGTVYDHEIGYNYDSAALFVESGPFKIGSGDHVANVMQIIPDEINIGDVQATFKTRYYPTDADTSHGPYTAAQPTDVRLQGRQVRMRLEAQSAGNWRIGNFRADVRQGGRR